MAFECPRRSSPPSPMFDADTGCIATDPAPSARRRFRSKTGIENLPPTNTPKKLRTRRLRHEPRVEFSQGARVVDPAFGMGCRVRHPNILTSRERSGYPIDRIWRRNRRIRSARGDFRRELETGCSEKVVAVGGFDAHFDTGAAADQGERNIDPRLAHLPDPLGRDRRDR